MLDMTTTDPALTRDLAKEAQARGAEFVDAPVFGSREESWNGKLDVVWGGKPSLAAKLSRNRGQRRGTPARTMTWLEQRVRRPVLYPIELLGRA